MHPDAAEVRDGRGSGGERSKPRFGRARSVLRELLLVAVAYGFYAWVRGQVGSVTSASGYGRAVAHAERVVSIERDVGLFREPALQRLALDWPGLVKALDSFWSYSYLMVTAGTVLWLLWRGVDRFRALRTSLFVATLLAVSVFAVFPTAPPRLLPRSYGMVDTWRTVGGIAARTPPRLEHISDPFASLPSLHVAWAWWCAIAVTAAGRHFWVKVAAWTYVAATVLAVVATGNHFILDCVSGAALMQAAVYAVPAVGRGWSALHRQVRDVRVPALDGGLVPDPVPVSAPPAATGSVAAGAGRERPPDW